MRGRYNALPRCVLSPKLREYTLPPGVQLGEKRHMMLLEHPHLLEPLLSVKLVSTNNALPSSLIYHPERGASKNKS